MGKGEFDTFQPHWADVSGLPEHLSLLSDIQESIDAAVVGARHIAEHSFNESGDDLISAGERLAASLTHLRRAVTAFAGRAKEPVAAAEPGFDEPKLLASIEKWQRRYQELEGEYSTVEARLLDMEETHGQVMVRVERSIEVLDAMLEAAGAGDEEN